MSKHSELPWSIYTGEDVAWWSVLIDGNDKEIGSGDGGFDEEDANLIIDAVNYHETLKNALRQVAGSLAWHAHGELRAVDQGPPLASNDAVELAKILLSELDKEE